MLSQKLGTVKAEVFREFMEHWTTHKKETEAFKLPGYTLMKKQYDVPVKEVCVCVCVCVCVRVRVCSVCACVCVCSVCVCVCVCVVCVCVCV